MTDLIPNAQLSAVVPTLQPALRTPEGTNENVDFKNVLDWTTKQLQAVSRNLNDADKAYRDATGSLRADLIDLTDTTANATASVLLYARAIAADLKAEAELRAQLLAEITTDSTESKAAIDAQLLVLSDTTKALAQSILQLDASFESLTTSTSASITDVRRVLVSANEVIGEAITTITGRLDDPDTGLEASADAIEILQTKINERSQTFRQASAPSTTGLNAGDIWIDTDDNNKLYILVGGAWVDSTAANMTVFNQISVPTTTIIGALWIDADDNSKLYRWNGSTWEEITDGRLISIAATYTTVTARADGGTASGAIYLEAIASPPTGYSAWYGWRIQAGGNYVGMRAMVTSGGTGEIAFYAAQFSLLDPSFNSGAPMKVFEYVSGVFRFFVPVELLTEDIGANQVTAHAASRSATGFRTADDSLTVPAGTYILVQGDFTGAGYSQTISVAGMFGTLYITNGLSGGGSILQQSQNNWVRDGAGNFFVNSSYISVEIGPLAAGTYNFSVVSTDNFTSGGTVGLVLSGYKR